MTVGHVTILWIMLCDWGCDDDYVMYRNKGFISQYKQNCLNSAKIYLNQTSPLRLTVADGARVCMRQGLCTRGL